ncbi:MAG: T9SS type A sorting domain-containing protein [Bacteroidia bacterium]
MKKCLLPVIILAASYISASAQSTYGQVYSIFQTSCAFSSCHSGSQAKANLDLVGEGATLQAKMQDVYSNLFNAEPDNGFAKQEKLKRVFPGHPYKSFLFKKINNGLQPDVTLHTQEGSSMPENGTPLEDEKIELIRQWILMGAPETGNVADTNLIRRYYNGEGFRPLSTIPAPPSPSQGFQIHLGPFFVEPAGQGQGEVEYFSKYDPQLENDIEVTRVETHMGEGYSHHFILFHYLNGMDNQRPYGLRKANAHFYTEFVVANQEPDTVQLPHNTAFPWEAGSKLDLNTHYINYSASRVMACDVYINIFTQPSGTAEHTMYTALQANTSINIPNDGTEHTFSQAVRDASSQQNIFMWALSSHTHKYGTDYDIFERLPNGDRGTHIFDASCPGGIPGCTGGSYDYQHPPVMYFEPLKELDIKNGLIHEAKYINTGPAPVGWGETSDDEMMVLLMMYTLDTAGIRYTGIKETNSALGIKVFPNPVNQNLSLVFSEIPNETSAIRIYNVLGKEMRTEEIQAGQKEHIISAASLPPGFYFFNINNHSGGELTGKFLKR